MKNINYKNETFYIYDKIKYLVCSHLIFYFSVELEINSDHKKKKSQKTKGKKKNLKEESDSGSEKDEEEMDDKDVEDDKNEDNAISKSENESELDEEVCFVNYIYNQSILASFLFCLIFFYYQLIIYIQF